MKALLSRFASALLHTIFGPHARWTRASTHCAMALSIALISFGSAHVFLPSLIEYNPVLAAIVLLAAGFGPMYLYLFAWRALARRSE